MPSESGGLRDVVVTELLFEPIKGALLPRQEGHRAI